MTVSSSEPTSIRITRILRTSHSSSRSVIGMQMSNALPGPSPPSEVVSVIRACFPSAVTLTVLREIVSPSVSRRIPLAVDISACAEAAAGVAAQASRARTRTRLIAAAPAACS